MLPLRRRPSGLVLVAALLVVATAAPASGARPGRTEPDLAQTTQGWVRGTVTGTHRLFKGIPFAAPPVGSLRWRPPQPAASWSGIRDATESVPSTPCPQPRIATLPGESNRLGSTDEDCLKLSVWTPALTPARDRPVFVWADALLYSTANPVFEYEFNDQNAPSFFQDPNLPQGAFHAADVGFLFRRAALSEAQERLSQTMTAYVANFVATGDPNRRGLPAWPRYRAPGVGPDRLDDLVQSLVPDAVAPTSGFKADHNCAFWQLVAGTPA